MLFDRCIFVAPRHRKVTRNNNSIALIGKNMDVETKTPESVTDASHLEISSDELDSIADSSRPFVGNWQNLISQTNWEKGKIILQWRKELAESGVDTRLYSDPAWSRLVGEVTPQHVGRLRRTWERFGDVQQDYEKLYWSHFFAALDWDDAEMWLEGCSSKQVVSFPRCVFSVGRRWAS